MLNRSKTFPQPSGGGGSDDVTKLIEKARGDVAAANPVLFLIRIMNGEEIDGVSASLSQRIEIAKKLSDKQLANLQSTELTGKDGKDLLPPALVIMPTGGGVANVQQEGVGVPVLEQVADFVDV
ncbi:hypothetical protein EBZ39_09370 [bacterium]|nr:hypothetical protein [bacterium]